MATAKKTTTRAKSTKSSPKKATSRAKTKTTAKKAAPQKTEATIPEPKGYVVRNLHHTEFNFRLDRQQEGKRRIELKPRGQRGDFAPLQEEDLNDPILQANLNLGVIEIITAAEAAKVAQKQTTNQQKVHPALAMIRNEYGEEYDEGAFSVDQSFEDQGVVVARLNDGQVAVGRGGIDRSGGNPEPEHGGRGSQRLRRPGTRPGTAGTQLSQTIRTNPSEQTAANTDAKARIKGLGGPSAGVPDGIQVTVAPTKRN